jgi:nucleotide-binding universal stress UspA family protein
MKLIEKILIATDLSSTSNELIENGIDIAKLVGAKIFIIYVLKLNLENKKIQDFIINAASNQLKKIKDKITDAGIECAEPSIAFGNTDNEIVKEATIQDVNVILMGYNGKSKSSKSKLGGSTTKVIQKTQIPIWVHKFGTSLKVTKILCPIDFSETSTRALKNAIVIAKKFNAKLIVLNVYESEHPYEYLDASSLKIEIEAERKINEEEFTEYLKGIDFRGIKWEYSLKSGFPNIKIIKAIKKKKVDLLIMGATGKSGLRKFFMGSVTEKVTENVPCSFIITKSKNVIKVVVEAKMNDLDTHFHEAQSLFKNGFYEKALREYTICLDIENLHIRSYNGMASIYEKLGNQKKADYYHAIAKDIYDYMWNSKIENEIRKFYQVKGDFHLQN